ncbi:MAG: InlB B-repeat-containing protein [Candidatus Azobacteroides sp.]|nr:InlB B-repeat-containing protein [Candidatus Azobacteroides sp.]
MNAEAISKTKRIQKTMRGGKNSIKSIKGADIKLFQLCLVVALLFATVGCDKSEIPPKYYTLNFAGEEIDIEPQSIAYGNYAAAPENPEREGYYFGGCFTDNGTFAKEWNFKTDVVTHDTTLYAKWEENALQGTKWKLMGIVDAQTSEIKILEPKDCEKRYTLAFDTDSTFSTFSSVNELVGGYIVDYTKHSFEITMQLLQASQTNC